MKQLATITVVFIALFTIGCASTETKPAHIHDPFTLSAEQADQIIYISIKNTWPDVIPGRLIDGRLGYSMEVPSGQDSDRVTAIAIPVGSDQYKFEVWAVSLTSGTTDTATRDKLILNIISNAKTVAEFQ